MILLVTSSIMGEQCAGMLEAAMGVTVGICKSLKKAVTLVRNEQFSAVVLDESTVGTDLELLDTFLERAAMAVPVYVNLAISSGERVVREVRSALRRNQQAELVALRRAESLLNSELRDAVTGIVLSSELALKIPALPKAAQERLQSVCELASQIRTRLESRGEGRRSAVATSGT